MGWSNSGPSNSFSESSSLIIRVLDCVIRLFSLSRAQCVFFSRVTEKVVAVEKDKSFHWKLRMLDPLLDQKATISTSSSHLKPKAKKNCQTSRWKKGEMEGIKRIFRLKLTGFSDWVYLLGWGGYESRLVPSQREVKVHLGMRRICRTVVAGRYPARRQEALGSSLARLSRIVRQKKAIVHTPWKIWKKRQN